MGKLYVVGFGPGDAANMTELCRRHLLESDIIVGYTEYVKLLRPLFPDKTFHDTAMTRETERCRTAIDRAMSGKNVCVVSSGDSGVYGMASLLFELAADIPDMQIEIVAGITAAVSGAALLGAPIGHDFVVISLSDLLTPWETIEKRLRAAADADFVLCLYNAGSKKRKNHLHVACDILLESLPPDRLCGIARNIGRDGQEVSLMTLENLRELQVSMTETIFIGNTQTKNIGGRMVTPRGYRNE